MSELLYDLIIVGARISGVEVARRVATLCEKYRRAVNILILEKANTLGRKPCGNGITKRAFEEFPHIKPFLDCYIYKTALVAPNLTEKLSFSSDDRDKPLISMGLNRADFDGKLLDHLTTTDEYLKAANFSVRMGTEVVNVEIKNDKAIVYTKDGGEYSGLVVVGADSTTSTVAKSLNIGLYDPKLRSKRKKFLNIAIDREILFENSRKDGELEIITFLSYDGLDGYAWNFPKKDRINIGVITNLSTGHKLHASLEKFERYLVEIGEIPKNLPKENYGNIAGAMLPGKRMYKKRIEDRVILVGDAGGFCFPYSGEGITPSLVSGKIAGEVIVSLLKKYDKKIEKQKKTNSIFSKSNLKKYIKLTDDTLKTDFRIFSLGQKILSDPAFANELVRWCNEDEKLANNLYESLYGVRPGLKFQLKMALKYIRFKIKRKKVLK